MATRKKGDMGITPVPAAAVDAFPRGTGLTVGGELNYLMRRMMEQGADGVTSSTTEEWPVARLEGKSVSAEVVFTPQALFICFHIPGPARCTAAGRAGQFPEELE